MIESVPPAVFEDGASSGRQLEPPENVPQRVRSPRLLVFAWPVLFALACGALQLSMRVPWDTDTGYHVAVARLMREHGILREFPWTRFSWLADNYADKEFLFHVALMPFVGLDWVTAARLVGGALGALVLCTIWGILRAEKVRFAGWWTLAALFVSSTFVFRLGLVRPHLMAISLALVVTWAAVRRRLLPLAAAAFLYPLCYTAFHTAIVLAVIASTATAASMKRLDWRPLAATVGGVLAGVLVHPHTKNLLRFFWMVNVEILGAAWVRREGFGFGAEFEPFRGVSLVLELVIPGGFAVAACLLAWRNRRQDPLPLAFALSVLAWVILTLRTQRFIEYAVPFAIVALALSWRAFPRPRFAALTMGATVAAVFALSAGDLVSSLRLRRPYFPDPTPSILQALVPAEAPVFTCEWDVAGEAMAALPGRRFMVALDPYLFYRRDPRLYGLWRRVIALPPERPAFIVRQYFGSRYALCLNGAFAQALRADPEARVLSASVLWTLFDVGG